MKLRISSTGAAALAAALAVAILAVHAARYWPFMADDAFISLRYSARLNAGHGLTWDDYEKVEGYSNLLWVLGCAALGRLGLDLVVAARVLGATSMAVAVTAVALGNRRGAPWAGALLLALGGPCAIWAIGGLEQPLVAALLAIALALLLGVLTSDSPSVRRLLAAGVAVGLIALTRPDGPLFAVTLGGTSFLLHVRNPTWRRRAVLLVAPTFALVGLQLVFRIGYYGDWVPNTAHVKLGFSVRRLHEGLVYMIRGYDSFAPVLVPLAVGTVLLLVRRASRARTILLLTTLLAWNAYVVFIGGDIFAGLRHHVVTLVLLAFLASECVAAGASAPWRHVRIATYVVAIGALALFWHVQQRNPDNLWALDERWEWQCKGLAEPFGKAFRAASPLVAVDPAGCFPYFSELPSLDALGLNDRYIATHRRSDAQSGELAHNLGHGGYVLSRQPDVVIFCTPRGGARACFPGGLELDASREFHAQYRLVGFALSPQRGVYWVNTQSPKIGIRFEEGHLEIPGFLFGAGPRGDAVLDASGAIGTSLGPEAPARIEEVVIPRGRYRLGLQPTMPAAVVTLRRWGRDALTLHEGDVFETEIDAHVDLEVLPVTESFLRAVRLEKLDSTR